MRGGWDAPLSEKNFSGPCSALWLCMCKNGWQKVASPTCQEHTYYHRSASAGLSSCLQVIDIAFHSPPASLQVIAIETLLLSYIVPLQSDNISTTDPEGRSLVHCSLNINTETGRLSAHLPNLQNQPALDKDRYKVSGREIRSS